ncbi:TRHDE protein, partial [Polypterus senegalus]
MRKEGKDINVKEVMDRWTLQMGFPVVTIIKNDSLDDSVTISQEHFIFDVDAKPRDSERSNSSPEELRGFRPRDYLIHPNYKERMSPQVLQQLPLMAPTTPNRAEKPNSKSQDALRESGAALHTRGAAI